MSIASEITRLQDDRSDIFTALTNKGVTVPSDATYDDVAGLIDMVPTGAPEPIIDPNITTCLYIQTGTGTAGSQPRPSFELDGTIEFTISPVADIRGADYSGTYGDITPLIYINSPYEQIKIGYRYGQIVAMVGLGYSNYVEIGDLLEGNLYNFKIKKDRIIFNQNQLLINTFTSSGNYLQYPNANNLSPAIKHYELKIYDSNGTATHRFVPAKNASNVNGLYECYGGDFYRSSGTTTLGPEMPL